MSLPSDTTQPGLRRSLGLFLLTAYGVGVTIGAGIYVLIGAVAAASGYYAPLAFLASGLVALFTALSFAELSVRYPVAAGEAAYVQEAFGSKLLPPLTGLLVICAGIVSSGTISLGAAGYLHNLTGLPEPLAVIALLALLGGIAAVGIRESVALAAVITCVEVGGLILVCVFAFMSEPATPPLQPLIAPEPAAIAQAILAGALLAFFAFIGFEDMVNVAEEVKTPERTLPRAILLTLAISTLLYLLVAWAATRAVAPAELAASKAPLALVAERAGHFGGQLVGTIAIIAALNGVLVMIIMGARVLYGLAARGQLPKFIGAVHPRTRTPVIATALVTALIGALAIGFPLEALAEMASRITLAIFALINCALIALKAKQGLPAPVFRVPALFPVLGLLSSAGLLAASFLTA